MYSALRPPVIALALLAALAGCGQMGPLYLPAAVSAAEDGGPGAEAGAPVTEDPAPAADAARPDDEEG